MGEFVFWIYVVPFLVSLVLPPSDRAAECEVASAGAQVHGQGELA